MTPEYEAITTALAMTEWFIRNAPDHESCEKLDRVADFFENELKRIKTKQYNDTKRAKHDKEEA